MIERAISFSCWERSFVGILVYSQVIFNHVVAVVGEVVFDVADYDGIRIWGEFGGVGVDFVICCCAGDVGGCPVGQVLIGGVNGYFPVTVGLSVVFEFGEGGLCVFGEDAAQVAVNVFGGVAVIDALE